MAGTDPESADERRKPRVGRALVWSVLSTGAILLLNIATGILLARELGPELRGALAAAILTPSLLGPLGVLGLVESVAYLTARRTIPEGELLGSALVLTLGFGAMTTGISAALMPLVLTSQSSDTVASAYIFLGSLPLSMLAIVLAGYVNGCHRYSWVQMLRVAVVLLAAIGLFGAALVGDLDVRTGMWSYLGANVISAALAVVMARRLLRDRLTASRSTARELLAFALRSFASTAAWRLNQRIDQPIIAALLAPAQLGLYVTAVTLSSLALLIGSSVIFVALPIMASLDDADERRRLARAVIGVTLTASALLTLPLLAAAGALLDLLFGSEFAAVAPVARILLVASVVLSVNRAIESVLIGIGRPADAAKAEILTLPVTATGLIVLLPMIGLVGAGWTSLAAYLTAFVLMSRRAATALGTTQRQLLLPGRTDVFKLIQRVRLYRAGGRQDADVPLQPGPDLPQ